jgi:hypothetical protein
MFRAIVYPHKVDRLSRGADEKDEAVYGGLPARDGTEAEPAEDRYAARLLKHVPAEAISVFLVLSSYPGISAGLLLGVLVVSAAGAVLYQLNREARLPKKVRPGWWSAAFTLVAFLAWAGGTSGNVQNLIGVNQLEAALVMTLVAFLLPAIDDRVGLIVEKRRARTKT